MPTHPMSDSDKATESYSDPSSASTNRSLPSDASGTAFSPTSPKGSASTSSVRTPSTGVDSLGDRDRAEFIQNPSSASLSPGTPSLTPVSVSSTPTNVASRSSLRSKQKGKKKGISSPLTPSSSKSEGSVSPLPSSPASIFSPVSPSTDGISSSVPGREIIRSVALYAFPCSVSLLLGLLFRLTTLILTPLYNTTPLALHVLPLYTSLALLPTILAAVVFGFFALPIGDTIDPRACLTVIAISSDLVVISARRLGSISGALFGPRLGAFASRWLLGIGAICGGCAFTILCLDLALPVGPSATRAGRILRALTAAAGSLVFTAHVYYAERLWDRILSGPALFAANRPEKSALSICLLMTVLSLFVRTPKTQASFADRAHRTLTTALRLSSSKSRQLKQYTSYLPRSLAPLLFLLRLPLLIFAIRQQVFLRPSPPFFAAEGTLQVLHSAKSITGQIVVGDNLADGYRYLRCDASLLGGRWTRPNPNGSGVELGDTIFATFVLQEVGILAARSDRTDSLANTISMTTDLEITTEADDPEGKPQPRALIIGLGVGISAGALSRRGYAIDVVEIDPAVYRAAVDYFDLRLSPESDIDTISLLPGQDYISRMSNWNDASNGTMQKWSYVIHDCFSAGKLPVEVYTAEFWRELASMTEDDGVVAANIAGVMGSLAARRIVVTLLSVFEQCRAFGELGNEQKSTGLMNMVVMCTMAHSPLLSFRSPTRSDVLKSPSRIHTYTTFQQREIRLDEVLLESDFDDPEMIISANCSQVGLDQISTAMETWIAMQRILTREMWLAW